MFPTTWRRRRVAAALTALAALAVPLAAGGGTALAGPAVDSRASAVERKTEAAVLADLDEGGVGTFWVRLDSAADLAGATTEAKTKRKKGEAVLRAKTQHAEKSQARLRKLLKAAGAAHTPFWISNTVQVTGDARLLQDIAALPEVTAVEAEKALRLPELTQDDTNPAVNSVNAVDWNVAEIRADDVWNDFKVRGEGIVVANIDGGVQFDHPALASQYRGRSADGTVSHDYNWFDPTRTCAPATPCDHTGHGTHTIGTIVGDDGAGTSIGVAPGAKWIAARGCESSSCSRASLLAAGQWIVAPTDSNGANPRPDLAPDVVNNSWGGAVYDPWYADIVNAWSAAGIFPAFSNGNSGPSCNTTTTPGIYPNVYSSGAYGYNGVITSFSSRGSGREGDVKPNITAPGAGIRSAIPGGGYRALSGTSMAAPHTAGVVALMWSAAPALLRDIPATTALLDASARDMNDTTCGGTADDNNVYGEGKLDAYGAVQAAPRAGLATLSGTVTADGKPLGGAQVSVDGPLDRTVATAADGTYTLPRLLVGDYAVKVSRFGHVTTGRTVTVTADATTQADFVAPAAPGATVSGTVSDVSGPVAGTTVVAVGTPARTVVAADGRYTLPLPYGSYQLRVTPTHGCAGPVVRSLEVSGDSTVDLTLPVRTDAYGYACTRRTGSHIAGTTLIPSLTGKDISRAFSMPFNVPLYGSTAPSNRIFIGTNGLLAYAPFVEFGHNTDIPATGQPNYALYPFWDRVQVDAQAGVYTGVLGTAPNRRFVVEWRNVTFSDGRKDRLSFSAVLGEDGSITYTYDGVPPGGEHIASSATIGMENAEGTDGFPYAYDTPSVHSGLNVTFRGTRNGQVRGLVTDGNAGDAVSGATVTLTPDTPGGASVTTTTRADGSYNVALPPGTYRVAYQKTSYATVTRTLAVPAGSPVVASAALPTGLVRVDVPAEGLKAVVPEEQRRTRALTVTNHGGAATAVRVSEAVAGKESDVSWLDASLGAAELAPGAGTALSVRVDTAGATPGSVLTAQLVVHSDGARTRTVTVPVTVVVPRYQVALDAGGKQPAARADSAGDSWAPDRMYTAGSYGFQGEAGPHSTKDAVSGTEDPWLYSTAREGMGAYRFDGVPNGTYTVELGFTETKSHAKEGNRVFGVLIEGAEVLPSLDIVREAGKGVALKRSYTVAVTDGTLDIEFAAGQGKPLVSAVRVTDRPDLAG
ncbi:S8 family serine peptidase [Streptomyces sp. NPDC002773]|uniref:S8 family serine peptidase n=1 Tax=Streptomyces sp. NPDC002773 TaxID=3154430 RepID=UPI003328CD1D